jgi:hypothetical protein
MYYYNPTEASNRGGKVSNLNWNDYFDNDKECGGSYESPDDYNARVARVKAYNESLKPKQEDKQAAP